MLAKSCPRLQYTPTGACWALIMGTTGLPRQFRQAPHAIGDLRFHRRRDAQLPKLPPRGDRPALLLRAARVRDIKVRGRLDQAARGNSQYSSNLPLKRQQRRAMMALAPRTVQNMPDRFRRDPMTDLQPASTTPEPTKSPFSRNSG